MMIMEQTILLLCANLAALRGSTIYQEQPLFTPLLTLQQLSQATNEKNEKAGNTTAATVYPK